MTQVVMNCFLLNGNRKNNKKRLKWNQKLTKSTEKEKFSCFLLLVSNLFLNFAIWYKIIPSKIQ